MRFEKLGNITEIIGGNPAPKGDDAFGAEGLPFVKMKDLGRYHLTNNLIEIENRVSNKVAKSNRLKTIKKGSILLPRSGSVALNHRAILGVDAYMVSHICALEIKNPNLLANEYLYYYLTTINFSSITKKTTGLDAITFQDLAQVIIPVPDYPYQLHIANLLSKAENLISQRKQSIALLDEFLKSTFLEMFGDPVKYEKGFVKCRFGDFVDKIIAGSSYGGEQKEYLNEDELGVLKVSAVTWGVFSVCP
ncbi:MAG: restriction endonuclease subunit S [Bacteroidales bacterium]|nr:restriction endonuclease subunit S [Bacteroidales bacterium]